MKHFKRPGKSNAACDPNLSGRIIPLYYGEVIWMTDRPEEVTCRSCLKTVVWRTERDALVKKLNSIGPPQKKSIFLLLCGNMKNAKRMSILNG